MAGHYKDVPPYLFSAQSTAVLVFAAVFGTVLGTVLVLILLLVAVLILLLIHLVHFANLQLFLRCFRVARIPEFSGSILCFEKNAA